MYTASVWWSGARKIVRRQFETRGRMGEQPAFGDSPDAAIPVPESFQDPGVGRPGFKPEIRFQGRERDHTFDGAVLMHEAKRHAAAIREPLRACRSWGAPKGAGWRRRFHLR